MLFSTSGCERASPDRSAIDLRILGGPGRDGGKFFEPRAIAISPGEKLFVIDKTGRIQRFSSACDFEIQWHVIGETAPGQPSGICIDRTGRVFVADTHRQRVVVYDADGNELFHFGEPGSGLGQFMLVTDVAVAEDGSIFVSEFGGNDRISKFDPQGRHLFSFANASAGRGAVQRPSGIAWDQAGNLWVADTNNHRICRYTQAGRFVGSIGTLGNGDGELRFPRDVAVLQNGDLVVADSGNHRLVVFAPDGSFVSQWGGPGRGTNRLNGPLNVDNSNNMLFIADSKHHRVVGVPATLLGQRPRSFAATSALLTKEDDP